MKYRLTIPFEAIDNMQAREEAQRVVEELARLVLHRADVDACKLQRLLEGKPPEGVGFRANGGK